MVFEQGEVFAVCLFVALVRARLEADCICCDPSSEIMIFAITPAQVRVVRHALSVIDLLIRSVFVLVMDSQAAVGCVVERAIDAVDHGDELAIAVPIAERRT